MPIPAPNLDDRDFAQLTTEARRRIAQSCPAWTDLSPGDPGVTLLEAFAYLTDQMIYRLNRLPDKAYLEFLNLIGLKVQPPAAASVMLRFSVETPAPAAIEIPRGTRVTLKRAGSGAEPPIFMTSKTVTLEAGKSQVEVTAHHAEYVAAELAGEGTGVPGLSVTARRAPIVADGLDLVVAVEATDDELDERVPALEYQGKAYRIWREVENFTDLGSDRFVYVADRLTGTIMFAPALAMKGEDGKLKDQREALAEIPAAGREIRLWYGRGGGPEGNVTAGALDTLKDPIAKLRVTNPAPATGGRAAETLENALLRGPQELHSLKRAVTAGDFEWVAMRHPGAVDRARAFTKATLWKHATPGTVEVLLVPHIPGASEGDVRVTAEMLKERQTETARQQIQKALDERRPLGTDCQVNWVRYKPVRAEARVVVHREEDPQAVEKRLQQRLNQIINPLKTPLRESGWPFGEPLRAFHIYETVRSEAGVSYVEDINLFVDEVPDKGVRSVTQDCFQPRCWYAAAGEKLFRTLDDGLGWEAAGRFAGEEVMMVRTHPGKAGLLAVATRIPGSKPGTHLYGSWDCGETWKDLGRTAFPVDDMAWTMREGFPVLLLAAEVGLFELALRPDRDPSPVQILVDPKDPDRGFFGVAVATDVRGGINVAVAARGTGGVYLSNEGGRSESFRMIGLKGEDARVLAVEYDGPRAFLWAGIAAGGENDPGKGCFRWELLGSQNPVEGWRKFGKEWKGGSVRSIAFQGSRVLASTFSAGVLSLARTEADPAWQAPDFVSCKLPLRDQGRLHPVEDVAVDPEGRLVMAVGPQGVHVSADRGVTYVKRSDNRFETVTLPVTWLFCSGDHKITVVSEDEAGRH